jgi:hypothetical protein
LGFDEEVCKSRDERYPIAKQDIFPFELTELLGVIFVEEC